MAINFLEIGVRLIDLIKRVPPPLPLWPLPRTKSAMEDDPRYLDLHVYYNNHTEDLETYVFFSEFWEGISESDWTSITDPERPIND